LAEEAEEDASELSKEIGSIKGVIAKKYIYSVSRSKKWAPIA
jgi:hypothetical protein